jgi:hypothetical protein
MGIKYATREQVKNSLEIAHSAWANSLVDSKLVAASRGVEKFLHRRFYPELRTVRMDWPNNQYAPTRQVWLGDQELISLTSLVSGGTAIATGNLFLRRGDDLAEPPYSYVEVDLSTSSSFSAGTTFQRSNVLTGVFGFNETDTTVPAHALLGGNINAAVTTMTVTPSSGVIDLGVGSLLLIGTERLVVTERIMSDTTQNLTNTLTASNGETVVGVNSGAAFARDEVILIDGERMKVRDIAGNNLIVARAWDGTVVAAHTIGADVYALRTLTVQRGALGSTAAAHTLADSIYAHQYPGLVNELTIAEAVVLLEQNSSGYARTVGSGPNLREAKGVGLDDVRQRCWLAYARKSRKGAI